jgi:hypothetical protein
MPELSIEMVIRVLPTNELVDAIESMLDMDERSELVWPVLNEIERRDPGFEI